MVILITSLCDIHWYGQHRLSRQGCGCCMKILDIKCPLCTLSIEITYTVYCTFMINLNLIDIPLIPSVCPQLLCCHISAKEYTCTLEGVGSSIEHQRAAVALGNITRTVDRDGFVWRGDSAGTNFSHAHLTTGFSCIKPGMKITL